RLGRARAALDNLAALLSKFDADDDGAIAQAFAGYCDALGQTAPQGRQRWLQRRVAWHRLRAARRFADHKVYRNCSDIAVQTAFRQFLAIVRQPGLTELRACLDHLPALVRRPDLCFLKRGNTCTVMACPLDGRDRVIKRYNIKSFWHALSRAWRPSRAARSWSNAHRLGMLGIETARPLALVESRWGPLRGKAYFFSDQVPGRDARVLFDDTQVSMETRRQVASAIAAMLHKLWRLGLVHGDLKAGNILVTADGRPVMLDLDAMFEARCRWQLRRGHVRDLRRWMKNWQDAPQTAELMQAALKAVYQNDDILRAAGIV
ncbi:MAG: hypothetical protein FGM62_03060, partial [Methylobacterium sp.]|nr:hypothetical protein [Methylobacterium sp.]